MTLSSPPPAPCPPPAPIASAAASSGATHAAEKDSRKKLHIKTHGCQMNVYDSERMADVLAPLGYRLTDSPADADLAIINTCHIREKAAEKVYGELGRLRRIKQERQKTDPARPMILAVSGCVAQAEGEEMPRREPALDLVVGPQAYHRLPQLLADVAAGRRAVETEFPLEDKFTRLPARRVVPRRAAAFVTIQEGCDRFCTFCVVPYTRGAESSRPAAAIAEETRALAENGVSEITLLGQNVNAWHGAGPQGSPWSLARLLAHLAEIPGIKRLRYTTSHPADMTPDLISAHGDIPELMPFVHLPVQSGSTRILKKMNRRHNVADYHRRIDALRQARNDLALSSDFIVGFPGETRADFRATLQLVRDIGYAQAYTFKYSPRPGTPAAECPHQVEETEKTDRLAELRTLLDNQQMTFNQSFIGHHLPVLFDRPGRHPGQIAGRSPYGHAVHMTADNSLIGHITTVNIQHAHANSLHGVRLTPDLWGEGASPFPPNPPSPSLNT